jgi:hypothetical protein
MFEPNRLAAEHLADAYTQLVPLRRRSTRAISETTEKNTDAERSIRTGRRRR